MPTLEEITAWSDNQILAELKAIVPKTLELDYQFDAVEGYWRLTLSRLNEKGERVLNEKGERVVELEELNMDGRLALLNVYGQYWLNVKPNKDSPWIRRHGELSREFLTKKVSLVGADFPDPDDLDPSKIHAMYHKQET